jgi:hypothetical protein
MHCARHALRRLLGEHADVGGRSVVIGRDRQREKGMGPMLLPERLRQVPTAPPQM